MSDTVSQPIALRLKEAGWEWETEKVWVYNWHGQEWELRDASYPKVCGDQGRLLAPSAHELRFKPDGTERLTSIDFRDYWWHTQPKGNCKEPYDFEIKYSGWLFTVTASTNELAKVWLWTRKEGSDGN